MWLLLGVIWGSTWLAIKIGLADLPPFGFAATRFSIAVVLLGALVLARRSALPRARSDWGLLATTGLLSIFLSYGLVFWGEQFITSGLTAILFTTLPLFGLVFAHVLVPGERLTMRKLAGVVLGIAGVTLIFGHQVTLGHRLALAGSAAVLVASAAAALSNVLVKARGAHLDPPSIAFSQMVVGLAPLALAALTLENGVAGAHWTPRAVASLLYLALVGSALAFVLFYWLIRQIEVTKVQLLILANTLVAVVLGRVVLGEGTGWRLLVGGGTILVGLVVSITARPSRSPATVVVRQCRPDHVAELCDMEVPGSAVSVVVGTERPEPPPGGSQSRPPDADCACRCPVS